MNVPDYSTLAEAVFNSYPEDGARLNALCDQCEADRAQFGEDDPRVQAGEQRVNALKGLFLRRIAWACYQQDPRFGLRRKTVGQIATRPTDGLQHSTDVLMLRDGDNPRCRVVDTLTDRRPIWSAKEDDTQPVEEWEKPLPPEGETVPAPKPVPAPPPIPPTPTDTSDLAARVAELEATIKRWIDLNGETVDALSCLNGRVVKIEQAPAPKPAPFVLPKLEAVGSVFGYRVRLPVQKA